MSNLPVLHREKELSKWKRGERLGSFTDNSVLRNAISSVKPPIPAGVVNLSGHYTRAQPIGPPFQLVVCQILNDLVTETMFYFTLAFFLVQLALCILGFHTCPIRGCGTCGYRGQTVQYHFI